MEMQDFLERIVDSENRRDAILSILDKLHIPYTLQELAFDHVRQPDLFGMAAFTRIMFGEDANADAILDGMGEDEYDEYMDRYIDFMELYAEEQEEKAETYTEILTNIIVDIGDFEHAEKKIIISAHHDVVKGSCGANDNGASIAILLKLLAENRGGCMRVVFFDGEETGGRGARGYIDQYVDRMDIKNTLLINLDVCGCGDLVVSVDHSGPFMVGMFGDVQVPEFPFSDASVFNWKGISSYSLSVFPKNDIQIFSDDKRNGAVAGNKLWKFMHCGPFDDIGHINYDIMEKVHDTLVQILSFLGTGLRE